MAWPQTTDYNEAIQNLQAAISDEELRGGEPVVNALGMPMPCSGNFADVYQVNCPATGKTWAVKCFTREVRGLRDRYRAISDHIASHPLPFMVDFQFVEPGLRIGKEWYPVLKMRWVHGLRLNQFVSDYLDKPKTLKLLLSLWLKLATKLREAGMAHADLQHGNVLLVPIPETGQLSLKLIDYDGMFVPSLSGQRSGESGHPAFQHPQRLLTGSYTAEVDRFSHLAIYTALQCIIAGQRPLWDRFDNGDNLLFREADFQCPETSELFHQLWTLPQPHVRALVGHLIHACHKPLDKVPLLDELVPDGAVRPLTPEEEREIAQNFSGGSSVVAVPRASIPVQGMVFAPSQPAMADPAPMSVLYPTGYAPPAAAGPLAGTVGPFPASAPIPVAAPAAPYPYVAPAFRRRKSFLRRFKVPIAIAGLVLLGAVGIEAVLLSRGGPEPPRPPNEPVAVVPIAPRGSGPVTPPPAPFPQPGFNPSGPPSPNAVASPSGVPNPSPTIVPPSPVGPAPNSMASNSPPGSGRPAPFVGTVTHTEPSASSRRPRTPNPTEDDGLPQWGLSKALRSFPALSEHEQVVLAPPPSPFLCDGRRVINVKTGEEIGTLNGVGQDSRMVGALAPDGELYAVAHRGASAGRLSALALFNPKTGEPAGELQMAADRIGMSRDIRRILFIAPRTLLVLTSDEGVLLLDVETGKRIREFRIDMHLSDGPATVSPDGKFLVLGSFNGIFGFDISKAKPMIKPVCVLAKPEGGTFIFRNQGLAFSPDGTEVAGIVENRVVVWNQRGGIVFDRPYAKERQTSIDAHIAWLPDGSGWMANGRSLLLREPKVVVWKIAANAGHRGQAQFISQDEVLIVHGRFNKAEAHLMPIPWEPIRAALKAASGGEAAFSPGDAVRVQVLAGPLVVSSEQKVQDGLARAALEVLSDSGYRQAADAPRTMQLQYSEPDATKASLLIQMIGEDSAAPQWKYSVESAVVASQSIPMPGMNGRVMNTEPITALQAAISGFKRASLPILIPKDPKGPRLPVLTDFGNN